MTKLIGLLHHQLVNIPLLSLKCRLTQLLCAVSDTLSSQKFEENCDFAYAGLSCDIKTKTMNVIRKFQKLIHRLRKHKKGKKRRNHLKLNRPDVKKIFIDAGAHSGESISYHLDKNPLLKGCKVYFFEPNPNYAEMLKQMEGNKTYEIIYKQEAVWIKNEELSFFISKDKWGDLGSTLLQEKNESLDRDHPLKVKAIDFAEFLTSNFSNEDYLIVKLDIEGAEYKVIEHLINTKAIKLIDEIWVEWHDMFYKGIDHFAVRYKLGAQDVAVYKWDL